MYSIDLNSDMGESFGAYRIGNDEGIIQHITSTNVACGYHAGDPMVMDKVVVPADDRGYASVGMLGSESYKELLETFAGKIYSKDVLRLQD